jgi:NCAIR mutase (PurE)-related protein
MNREQVLELLELVKNGKIPPKDALLRFQATPLVELDYATIDYHRELRQGNGEIIYGQGKTPKQIKGIVSNMLRQGLNNIIITRTSKMSVEFLLRQKINLEYHGIARLAIVERNKKVQQVGSVVIASGGTSDIPVCEEAAITAEALGSKVKRLCDVGVAGLHRLLSWQKVLTTARVIVVIAGMEGALASVIGGLVSCPVIAVPTSVGYGSNFGGLSALLAMLNSCANGISVVNIDNGFGAGYIANLINKMESIR